jgi:hypothetical protein
VSGLGPSVLNLQGWPGRVGMTARPSRGRPHERLGDRSGMVFVAAADRGAPVERFGLGAYMSFSGHSILSAGLVMADNRPDVTEALGSFCARRVVETPAGPRSWELRTLSEFFDYRTGQFTTRVYVGAGWLVTADLGRTLGLVAEADSEARGSFWRGGFTLYLPTWSETIEREGRGPTRQSVSPHRPPLRVKTAGAHGYAAQFAPAPGGGLAGKRNPDGTPYRGRFLDVVTLGHVLDGVDSGDLADHLAAFGFDRLELPAAIALDEEGAETVAALVEAVRSLGCVLDEEAARWLTTAEDRTLGYGRLDLGGLVSPAGLASEIVRRSGADAPLLKFPTPDDAGLDRWIAAHHGGWLSAELAGEGLFPAVDADVHSAYPAFAALLGWWRLMTAARVRRQDVTSAVRALCGEAAAGDVSRLFDRRTWQKLGFTLGEVVCDGEAWPVEAPDADYPLGHSGMRPVHSPVALPFTWPDVVNAALRSGRVPEIVSATHLVPVGRQNGLRARYPLYGGHVLGIDDDPAVALVRLRDRAKALGDRRLAAQLRVVVNAAVYGNPVRLDGLYERDGRHWVLSERPAEWTFPPIAATVSAASRLALGMAERLVIEAGGTVASRDTDGLLLVSSPAGGRIRLASGRQVEAIAWQDVERVLTRFDSLDPYGDGGRFWKVDREHEGRPLHGLVTGVKRYVLSTLDDQGELLQVVKATEHALGGSVVDPPTMAGQGDDGRHRWTHAVAEVAVRREIARVRGKGPLALARWPWEEAAMAPFPSLGRVQAASVGTLAAVRKRLGIRPFGLYVEAFTTRARDVAPVGLDPGGDLSDWAAIDWRGAEGEAVRVSTDPSVVEAVALDNLGGKAFRWLRPRPVDETSEVAPALIRRVGKAGGVIEAGIVDLEADTSELRAVYDDGDPVGFVVRHAQELGPRSVARRYGLPLDTAKRLAAGQRRPSKRTVGRVLRALRVRTTETPTCPVDGRPVFAVGKTYCSPRCRSTARKRRQRGRPLKSERDA